MSLSRIDNTLIGLASIGVVLAWYKSIHSVETRKVRKSVPFNKLNKAGIAQVNTVVSQIWKEVNDNLSGMTDALVDAGFSLHTISMIRSELHETLKKTRNNLSFIPSVQQQSLISRSLENDLQVSIQKHATENDGVGLQETSLLNRSYGRPSPNLSHDILHELQREARLDGVAENEFHDTIQLQALSGDS